MRRVYIAASRGRDPLYPTDRKRSVKSRSKQHMDINCRGLRNTLTSVSKDNMVYVEYD